VIKARVPSLRLRLRMETSVRTPGLLTMREGSASVSVITIFQLWLKEQGWIFCFQIWVHSETWSALAHQIMIVRSFASSIAETQARQPQVASICTMYSDSQLTNPG
jgi:hypothetical protein